MSDLAEEIYAATGLTLAGPAVAGIAKILEARDARIAKLEATVATIQAERAQLIGALQVAVERSGDLEPTPSWLDGACRILNRGFLKVDRAALEGGKS